MWSVIVPSSKLKLLQKKILALRLIWNESVRLVDFWIWMYKKSAFWIQYLTWLKSGMYGGFLESGVLIQDRLGPGLDIYKDSRTKTWRSVDHWLFVISVIKTFISIFAE